MMVNTDVIMPAYNEEKTIGPLVQCFLANPHARVIVVLDPKTKATDETVNILPKHNRLVLVAGTQHGKGQGILQGLRMSVGSEVVLCDADITMTDYTVSHLMVPLSRVGGQRIVVPQPPTPAQWRAAQQKAGLIFNRQSWPWVSGIRRVRTSLIPLNIYGYLTEVMINAAVQKSDTPYTGFHYDSSIVSPLRFTDERVRDLHEHGQYGKERGLIP